MLPDDTLVPISRTLRERTSSIKRFHYHSTPLTGNIFRCVDHSNILGYNKPNLFSLSFFFLSRSLNIISSELSTSIHSQYMDKETLLINFYHSRFVLDSDMPLFKHFYDVLYLSSISSLHYISQMYFNIHRCILLEYDFISGTLSFFSCCLTYKCISFMVLLILNVLLWNHNINYVIYLIKINLIFLWIGIWSFNYSKQLELPEGWN